VVLRAERILGFDVIAGFADIEDGVTVDLSGMNTVQFRGSASVVSVGPGARWQKVYDTIDPYGVSIQGGRNGDVGVGGFLTGGKYTLLFDSATIH
jgi:FAD/FMN-containing dehydrogenase